MAEKALVWRAFDAVEQRLAPRLEDAVGSDAFLGALGVATRAQARVRRDLEARSRRLWHLVNLPAGSDVAHLRRQLAHLDRELRRVSVALERALDEQDRQQGDDDADASPSGRRRPAGAGRAAGSRPPGRRAQRAAGS